MRVAFASREFSTNSFIAVFKSVMTWPLHMERMEFSGIAKMVFDPEELIVRLKAYIFYIGPKVQGSFRLWEKKLSLQVSSTNVTLTKKFWLKDHLHVHLNV